MPRLPPAEKLPLSIRKNVRDEWDPKKVELTKKLTELLGAEWTIEVNPAALYPYAEEGSYGNTATGNLIESYFTGAYDQLSYNINREGEGFRDEINDIAHAHVITIDYTEDKSVRYSGVTVSEDGKLVILFGDDGLGSNAHSALEERNLKDALAKAPNPAGKGLNFRARISVANDLDPKIGEISDSINQILNAKLTLNTNLQATFDALKAASDIDSDWDENLGRRVFGYFEGLRDHIKYKGFDKDELLQEGLTEAVEKNEIKFRIVEKTPSYNETVIEDGILYLQTTPKNFGTNVHYIAEKLEDIL